MNEEEAIEELKKCKDCHYHNVEDCLCEVDYQFKETVLNLLENQKAELDNLKTIEEENKFLRKQELGYIAGYEDGKKYKMTAVAMRIENMKYELYERHIKALKKRIEDLLSIEEAHRKENGKLRAEIEKKDKQIDLMAEELVKAHEWFYSEFDNYTKEDFIKYFEKKAEEDKQC